MTMNDVKARIERFEKLDKKYKNAALREPGEFEKIQAERDAGLCNGWGPLVGMPVTYTIGSDSYAGLVTQVSKTAAKIRVVKNGTGEDFTLRQDGRYRPKGSNSGYLTFLKAETQLDPSF